MTAANRLVSASAKEFDETPQRRPLAPVHYQPAEQLTGQAVARGSVPKPTLELSHREAAPDEAHSIDTADRSVRAYVQQQQQQQEPDTITAANRLVVGAR